jgi:hypothetical protein
MADTGWLTPVAGSVLEIYPNDGQFLNSGRITDLTPSQFCSNSLPNYTSGSFAAYGGISGTLAFNWPNPVGTYPSNAIIDRVEMKMVADFRTADNSPNQIKLWCRNIWLSGDDTHSGYYLSRTTDELPPEAQYLFHHSTTANPDYGADDIIWLDSETPGYGQGVGVDYFLNQKWNDAQGQGMKSAQVRFQCGGWTSGAAKTATMRIGTIQMKIHYSVPVTQIDMDSEIAITVGPTVAKLSHLKSFPPQDVPVNIGLTAANLRGNYVLASPVVVAVTPQGLMSTAEFVDSDCNFGIAVGLTADLIRFASLGADLPVVVEQNQAELRYMKPLYADASFSVGLDEANLYMGSRVDIGSSVILIISLDAQASVASVYLGADVGVAVTPNAELGHRYALLADCRIAVTPGGTGLVRDQYLASYGFIDVYPSADLLNQVKISSGIPIGVSMSGYITYGPTQSDALTERKMVIEPGERTMVISPSDRTLTIATH